jgi:predicted DNA-binding ribbon-helix-helix protein
MFDPEKASFQKRSLNLLRHKTSVSLEKAFWQVLEDAAHTQHLSLTQLIQKIDENRTGSLASALRLYVLAYVSRCK